MQLLRAFAALSLIDIKSVHRDPMLRWLMIYPIFFGLMLRWVVPLVTVWLSAHANFDFAPYYPLLMSLMLLVMPGMCGAVIGFVLLDHRDDGTLMALQVTPLTLNGSLVYRITAPMLLSVVTTLIMFPLAGLVEFEWLSLLIVSVAAAPLAPLYAVAMAAFAANKVQGFALAKAAGVLIIPVVAAYFLPIGWQLVCGLVPHYWPAKLFWMLYFDERPAWVFLIVGLVYQCVWLWILLRRFHRVVHR